MRQLALAALVIGVTACGQAPMSSNGGTRYTVTSFLMQKPGQRAMVCYAMALPNPPIGCGGVPIADLDLKTMSDAQTFRSGVVEVGAFRVVGTWSDGLLHLTEPPTPVAANSRTPLAACSQNPGDESPTDTAQGQKLIADTEVLKARGIVLLEFYMCRGSLFIGVAVADKGTVDFLSTRYAPAKVTGWLQPVS